MNNLTARIAATATEHVENPVTETTTDERIDYLAADAVAYVIEMEAIEGADVAGATAECVKHLRSIREHGYVV